MGLDDFHEGAEYMTALDDHYFIQNTFFKENKIVDEEISSLNLKLTFYINLVIQPIICFFRLVVFAGKARRSYRKLKVDLKFWSDRFRTQEFLQNREKNLRGSYTYE